MEVLEVLPSDTKDVITIAVRGYRRQLYSLPFGKQPNVSSNLYTMDVLIPNWLH